MDELGCPDFPLPAPSKQTQCAEAGSKQRECGWQRHSWDEDRANLEREVVRTPIPCPSIGAGGEAKDRKGRVVEGHGVGQGSARDVALRDDKSGRRELPIIDADDVSAAAAGIGQLAGAETCWSVNPVYPS